VYPKRRSPS
jgi:hypothetical protein